MSAATLDRAEIRRRIAALAAGRNDSRTACFAGGRSMSAAHTPGTWQAVEVGQGGPADAPMPSYEIHADGRAVVAEFVDERNARLIAAAPELLAALQQLVAAVEWSERKEPHNLSTLGRSLKKARAAIARASGDAA